MRYIYTKHVRLRMQQRGLTTEAIEETVRSPERTMPSFRGRHLAQRRVKRKTLEVVYKRLGDTAVIITAYWLDEGG